MQPGPHLFLRLALSAAYRLKLLASIPSATRPDSSGGVTREAVSPPRLLGIVPEHFCPKAGSRPLMGTVRRYESSPGSRSRVEPEGHCRSTGQSHVVFSDHFIARVHKARRPKRGAAFSLFPMTGVVLMRWNNWNPLPRLLTVRRPVRTRPPLELEMLESLILPSVGAGTGLTADYYSDANLTNLAATRTDATVNFDWAGASPAPSVAPSNFSVRWTGQVQTQYSETYTFFTQSTHGVRLWVNGQQIINDWADHPLTEDSATVALQAGQTYSIRMEYSQTTGDDTARLLWSSPSTSKQIIPTSQLYPGGGWLDGDVGARHSQALLAPPARPTKSPGAA